MTWKSPEFFLLCTHQSCCWQITRGNSFINLPFMKLKRFWARELAALPVCCVLIILQLEQCFKLLTFHTLLSYNNSSIMWAGEIIWGNNFSITCQIEVLYPYLNLNDCLLSFPVDWGSLKVLTFCTYMLSNPDIFINWWICPVIAFLLANKYHHYQ